MRRFLAVFVSILIVAGHVPVMPATALSPVLNLEAEAGARPELHVIPPADKNRPLIRALTGGQPVDALRLQGEDYKELPAFCCLVMGETFELRFADATRPGQEIKAVESLRLLALNTGKPLLIELEADQGFSLRLSGRFGRVNPGAGIDIQVEGQAAAGAHATIQPPAPQQTAVPPAASTSVPQQTAVPPAADPCAAGHRWGKPQANAGAGSHTLTCLNNPAHTLTQACTYQETANTATCEATGVRTLTCSLCGQSVTESSPALQHLYGAPKPNGDGTHTSTCARDAIHTRTEACTEAPGNGSVPATCTANGSSVLACSVCQGTRAVSIPALGHKWPSTWLYLLTGNHGMACLNRCGTTRKEPCTWQVLSTVLPDCEHAGSINYICQYCSGTKTLLTLEPALGHDWQLVSTNFNGTHNLRCNRDTSHTQTVACVYEDTVYPPPSCTTDGMLFRHCSVCGYETNSVLPAAHSFVDYPYPAGCTYAAYNIRVCSNCGEWISEPVPGGVPLGHDYSIYLSDKTVTEGSLVTVYKQYKCTRCDNILNVKSTIQYIIPSGVSATISPSQTPTPTTPPATNILLQSVPVYENVVLSTAATCTEGGTIEQTINGVVSLVTVPPLGHDVTNVSSGVRYVIPGWVITTYDHCNRCGVRNIEYKFLHENHTWVNDELVYFPSSVNGYENLKYCSVCNYCPYYATSW